MFESTGWHLDETNKASNLGIADDLVLAYVRPTKEPCGYQFAIVKRFDFESKLQRMSTIVRN